MSDPYSADYDDIFGTPAQRLRKLTSPTDMAAHLGVADVDEDPDQAARSLQLSRATGTPAPVIHGDLEEFERQHKQQLVGEMIRNSEALTDYVNTFPMASKVSNDDYPNLEEVNRAVRKAFGPFGAPPPGVFSAAWEGIKEGFDVDSVTPPPEQWKQAFEYFQPKTSKGVVGATAVVLSSQALDILSKAFRAGIHGIAKGGAEWAMDQPGFDETDRRKLEREIGSMLEWATNRGDFGTIQPKFTSKQVVDSVERLKPYIDAKQVPPPGVDPWLDFIKTLEADADLKGLKDAQKAVKQSATFERSPDAGEYFLKQQIGDRQIGVSADAVAELYGGKRPMPDDGLLGWVPDLEQQMRVAIETGGDIKVPLAGWLARMDPAVAKQLEEHLRLRPEGVTKFEGEGITELAQVAEKPGQAKTKFELEAEEHAKLNKLPEISDEQRISLIQGRIRQIEYDRRLDRVEGEKYPPHAELFSLRQRLRTLRQELLPRDPRTVEDLARREAGFEPLAQVGDRGIRLKPMDEALMSEKDLGIRDILSAEPASEGFHLYDNDKLVGSVHLRQDQTNPKVVVIEDVYSTSREGKGAPLTWGLHAVRGMMDEIKRLHPDAEKVIGFRVTGAREQASFEQGKQKTGWTTVSLKAPPQEFAQFFEEINPTIPKGWTEVGGLMPREPAPEGTIREAVTDRVTAEWRPAETYTAHEAELAAAVQDVIKRMAPKLELSATVDRTELVGHQVHGLYIPGSTALKDLILVTLRPGDPSGTLGTAFHEVIHHLRSGFFSPLEWRTLERAAKDGGWIDRHRIEHRYTDAPDWLKLEEAIAEQFREWTADKFLSGKISSEAISIFERLRDFLDAVAEKVRQVFGKDVTWETLFEKTAAGEIGARKPTQTGRSRFAMADFAEATAAEEAQLFAKGKAIGMTEAQFKRYMSLIEKKNQEIEDRAKSRAERATQVTKTEQWKENEPRVREEVTEAINQRPDVMADDFFRRGLLNGEKVQRPKFGTEFLTKEQQEALGPGMHREGGANPNDTAGLFGYFTGEDMINALANIQTSRQARGMNPEAYKKALVRDQTERVMMKRYGVPEHDSLLREMREDIITETQMDMLAEETMALATKTGQETPFAKDQLKSAVHETFAQAKMANARDMEGFLRQAGKAGRAAELALLKGDPTEAFRQKQRQFIATLYANEAKALAKEEARLERIAKQLAPREVKNREQEYVDYAQTILRMAGYAGRRDLPELQHALSANGYASFESFILSKQADKWEISAPKWVTDFNIPKVDEMTTQQFREFKEVVDTLNHTAREAKQVTVVGDKRDFDEFKAEVRQNIKSLPLRPPDKPKGFWAKTKQGLWRIDASLAKPEEIIKDLDLREELGPLWGALFHGLVDAKHTEMGMQERLTKDLNEIRGFGGKWRKTLSDSIPNDFFMDPYYSETPTPFELTRSDLVGIMLYWGNRSNIKKFTEGYGGKDGAAALEIQLKSLMNRYATAEDWDFVRKAWGTMDPLREDSDKMYRRVSGVPPKWIAPDMVDTPHGQFPGGFFPIFWDPSRSRIEASMHGGFFDKNFQSSTTSNHYTIERTGYVDRINFRGAVDMIASRYQQMIHDISHREAVMNAQKVLKDQDIRSDIRKHYGPEYLEQLDYTFKNLANRFNVHEQQLAVWQDWLRKARFNVIVHALGLNLRVILSPATGKFGIRDIPEMTGQIASTVPFVRDIANWTDNHALGMEKSKELPHTFRNMDRDFRERLEQVTKDSKWSRFKEEAFKWAMAPTVYVDQQFRVMTFVHEYKDAKARGLSEGEAVSVADSAVRERHGAAGIADLAPVLQTNNEFAKLGTLFYGWFNTMYNWQRQIPGQLKRGEYMEALKTGWWSVIVPSVIGAALFNTSKEDDSYFKIGAKALALQVAGTLPLGREFANLFIEGQPARSPWSSIGQAIKSAYTDVEHILEGKSDPKRKYVQHGANVIGLTMGLPMGQVGRTAQFETDVAKGRQHPRNIWEYIRGIIHGEAQLKKGSGR